MKAIRPNEVVGFFQENIDNTVKFINENLTTPALVQLSKRRAREYGFDGYAIMAPPFLKLDLEAQMVTDVFRNAGWVTVDFKSTNEQRGGYLEHYVILLSDQASPYVIEPVLKPAEPAEDGKVTAMSARPARQASSA